MMRIIAFKPGPTGSRIARALERRGVDLTVISSLSPPPDNIDSIPTCSKWAEVQQMLREPHVFLDLADLDQGDAPATTSPSAVSKAFAAGVSHTQVIALKSYRILAKERKAGRGDSPCFYKGKGEQIRAVKSTTIYVPYLYSDEGHVNHFLLRGVPRVLTGPLLPLVSAFVPMARVETCVDRILEIVGQDNSRTTLIASDHEDNLLFCSLKRVLDVTFAIVVLVGFWWLLAAIWVVIRLESPGPGLFLQERVGKNGRVFTCVKFRTMRQGTPQAGTHELPQTAVTGLGRLLRRTKLDELPQAWNILRNEISLVGPRPCLPGQHEIIKEREQRGVLRALPGISGLAQVNRIDMSTPALLAQWDAEYLALRTVPRDIAIIWHTLRGKGHGDALRGAA